ncbi:LETM1-domain-containing protein [Coniochaeta ligniaria NRRL 30616]|uniref:LETM1-domain-containing protein n=1 Tax=Coniochaeta ligniaria NRRL 30616 TaxID=1408157 RepID=A0A1J7I9T0_9PEZI|nr:LETM1-domain-containing protein [Coniochaeta ligniaria NRRL 30616]
MSASASVARRATVMNPFLGTGRVIPRSALRAASIQLMSNSRGLGLQNPGLALLIPLRTYSTETDTHRGPPAGPPPGFDVEKAKRPITQEANAPKTPASKEAAKEAAKKEADLSAKPTTLSELAAQKEKDDALEKKDDKKKLTLMQKIKHEAQHYWDGTKLLAAEVRISSKLALKMAAGYELSRREHRQLQRTVQDLGRLVPFSVFVIVPFAELLLPFALKIFPGLLPSTYEATSTKEKKTATLRATRKEVSEFLRKTLKETGLPLTPATAQKEEFTNFFRKVRATGEKPTAEDVIKVCKTFKDDLTLDNLSRPQLVSMCRYLNLNSFGTDMMLRYQIRHRMRQIKRDDRVIAYEGVDSLSVAELQTACMSRGIKTHGVSPARLRDDLNTWLRLRLKEGVPSTLLVLSNAYMYGQTSGESGDFSQIDALTGVLSSIPEELFHEIELEVHNAEGAATNKQRLEVLKEQQELIEEENEQNQENQETGFATPRDTEDIDEKEERHAAAEDAGIPKAQVSEAIEAEHDQPEGARVVEPVEADKAKIEK